MDKITTDYITASEYGRRHGVSESAIRNAIKKGRLPAKKIGGRWGIPADSEWTSESNALTVEERKQIDESKERKETYKAELLRLKIDEIRGTHVRAADAKIMWRKICDLIIRKLSAIPERCREKNPALTDDDIAVISAAVENALVDIKPDK